MDLHLVIAGRVQGVGYRHWLRGRALSGGVAGWARNRTDGTVEAVLSGSLESVEALVAEAGHGPAGARVDDVRRREARASELQGIGADFVVASSR